VTDRGASIDDLLEYGDDRPASSGLAATVTKSLLLAAVATAATVGLLRLGRIGVPVALVAVGYCALLALRFAVRRVGQPPPEARRRLAGAYDADEGHYHWPTPDAMLRATMRWEQRLTRHADTPGTFGAQLQPALRELADERLRLRDGATLAGDAARVRAVLGEPAWAVLAGEHRRGPGRRELSQLVARLEELT